VYPPYLYVCIVIYIYSFYFFFFYFGCIVCDRFLRENSSCVAKPLNTILNEWWNIIEKSTTDEEEERV